MKLITTILLPIMLTMSTVSVKPTEQHDFLFLEIHSQVNEEVPTDIRETITIDSARAKLVYHKAYRGAIKRPDTFLTLDLTPEDNEQIDEILAGAMLPEKVNKVWRKPGTRKKKVILKTDNHNLMLMGSFKQLDQDDTVLKVEELRDTLVEFISGKQKP